MPTYPDIRAVEKALITTLSGDPILVALMPGGVVWDVAPPALTAFVSVSYEDFVPDYVFGELDNGMERAGYLIKAVFRGTATDTPLDAAARIHDLLHRQALPLTNTGFELMVMQRARRVRYSERDVNNAVWQHIGGVYEVMVTSGTLP